MLLTSCALGATSAPSATRPHVELTIAVPGEASDVTVDRTGVWVIGWSDRMLSHIDPTTNTVVDARPIADPGNAETVAIIAGEGSLWVTTNAADARGNPAPLSVLRIDPASGSLVASVPLDGTGRVAGDVTVGAGAVWVSVSDDNSVLRIDPSSNQVVARIPVTRPLSLAADAGAVWVASGGTDFRDAITRIDPATNLVVATVNFGPLVPEDVALGNGAVWVTAMGSPPQRGHLINVDPAANQVLADIVVGDFPPRALAVANESVWVGMDRAIARISAVTHQVTGWVALGDSVNAMAASDDSLWVVHHVDLEAGGPVWRIDD